jgi:hypothetical protein
MSLWNVFLQKCHASNNTEGFVFIAIDGRFMAMVKHSAKTRPPSHVELSANPAHWRFYTKKQVASNRVEDKKVQRNRQEERVVNLESQSVACR